jgi:hypothetical protein
MATLQATGATGFLVVWVTAEGDTAGLALADDAAAVAQHRAEARWDVRFARCDAEVYPVSEVARRLGMPENSPAAAVLEAVFTGGAA